MDQSSGQTRIGIKEGHLESIIVEKIYFDMDGVLADFEGGVSKFCGIDAPPQDEKARKSGADDEMWEAINEAGYETVCCDPLVGRTEKRTHGNHARAEEGGCQRKLYPNG